MCNLTLQPAAEQRAFTCGRSVRMSELSRVRERDIYVPEGLFAAALALGASPEQLAPIVCEPMTPAQANPASTPLLAQANQAPATTAQRLHGSTGPLSLFAFAGLMSLLGGIGLTIRRRLFARSG